MHTSLPGTASAGRNITGLTQVNVPRKALPVPYPLQS